MVHVQRWDRKETTLVREVNGNNLTLVSAQQQCARVSTFNVILFHYFFKNPVTSLLSQTLTLGNIVCQRFYEKGE